MYYMYILRLPCSGKITIPTLTSYDSMVHLNYSDISVDNPTNPSIVKVRLKRSKPILSVKVLTFMWEELGRSYALNQLGSAILITAR